jgi:predicted DNA-binding transcriptional regulator YafY
VYFPTTRVLTILELLQSHRELSGPELAARLEVNPRTVRRYITMLQDLGIPVEAGRGRYGCYRLRPGFKLPPLMFTDEEVLAVTLGLLAARRLQLAAAAPAVEGALAKIERVLPTPLRESVRALQETLVLDFPPMKAAPRSEIVITLCIATQQERRVQLRYSAWDASETERAVDPYGLVYRSGFWYAVGYCHLREDLRVFRLDRVRSVKMRDETYIRPPHFDCLEYVTRSIAMTPGQWQVEVRLEITLEEAQRIVPPSLATLEQTTDGVLFRCNSSNLEWISYVLVSLECSFIVLNPPELRDALRQLAEKITAMAGRSR